MIPVQEAYRIIRDSVKPNSPELVSLDESHGCQLAEDVCSAIDIPGFTASIMDGVAVNTGDLTGEGPWELPVQGLIAAGDPPGSVLKSGCGVKIMTGAPVPTGADAVIKVEDVKIADQRVLIDVKPPPDQFIRAQGDDIRQGDTVLETGAVLDAIDVGILASIGTELVRVIPRPGVTIIPTGPEIVFPGVELTVGQRYDSAGILLKSLLRRDNYSDVRLSAVVMDDVRPLAESIDQGLSESDLVITVGSVSMGDFDLVPEAVRKLGGRILFHRVRIKPGKPVLLAEFNQGWLLGIPGNPVASLTGYHLWIKRIMSGLMGIPHSVESVAARMGLNLPLSGQRLLMYGVRLTEKNGSLTAYPSLRQDSGRLSSVQGTDGFIYAEPAERKLALGESVSVELL